MTERHSLDSQDDSTKAVGNVHKTVPDSAAAEGGLEIGDVIRSIDGEPVDDYTELSGIVRSHPVGDTVTLEIDRADSTLVLDITLKWRGTPHSRHEFCRPTPREEQ